MKLSENTLDILRNFSEINKGIVVKNGNVLSTMSPQKNILAEASVPESFPVEFGIYDLGGLIGFISLFGTEPDLGFEENQLVVSYSEGKRGGNYRYTDKKLIIFPPEKKIILKTEDIVFSLSEDDLLWVTRAASVVKAPNIAVASNGSIVKLVAFDTQNDASNKVEQIIGDGNGDVYTMIFKTENLKLIPGSYDVAITKDNIARFSNKNGNLTYWVSSETGSKFEGKE